MQHGTTAIPLALPAVVTATGNGTPVDVSTFKGICLLVLAASATGGAGQTGTVKLQHADESAGTYTDTGDVFQAVTNAATSVQTLKTNANKFKKFVRVVDTMAGTDPTYTRSVMLVGVPEYSQ